MAKRTFVAELTLWVQQLSRLLHQANAWRLASLLWGMLFSRGRRTVACWLRTGELGSDYKGYYYFLGSLGRNVTWVAGALLRLAMQVLCPGERPSYRPNEHRRQIASDGGLCTSSQIRIF